MNRIDTTFAKLKSEGRKGLVGFLTVGDPSLEQSERDIRTALDAGVDVLELGVPFSDPTADGPTIQAASFRALQAGVTLNDVLALVGRIRADYETPIVLFGYANLLFRYGYELLCADAAAVGVDGLLVVDLPFEEAGEIRQHMDGAGLHFISLVAPTTPPARQKLILSDAKGFVYYIMVTGVTGARAAVASDIGDHLTELREATDLPIAVGFGVSSGVQAKAAAEHADAVVVGSALISAARDGRLESLVCEIRAALDKE
ncbi:MAG: tryptophan synthase subunit alpha [Verrucomicrobia bacterium]|jgi:tryptophan synthase alpha chain|nr:tryptophan synthase subunit alpha [Verrucomicrobiota bacterium]